MYFSSDDPNLPAEHPRRVFLECTNGFITSDHFDETTVHRTRELYGKITQAHIEAERRRVRNDTLLD